MEWYSRWTREFDWDDGNVHKNEKHRIDVFEIEEIFETSVYIAGRILEGETEPRWLLLGETGSKGWSLIVTTRGQKLRVISCRRQRKEEAKFYESLKKKIETDGL